LSYLHRNLTFCCKQRLIIHIKMAQQKVTRVGIAGPTGRFGSLVLDALLEKSDIKVRALCRNASKLDSERTRSTHLEVIEGDVLDHSILAKFVDGLDVVICAYLGDNDFMLNAQKALIDACDAARVSRYLASDYTFDYTKLEFGEHPGKDPVKAVHKYLKGRKYVRGVHVLVGAFIETFWSGYFQVWDPEEKKLVYWDSGEEVWEFTKYFDSARYTAAVALDPNAVGVQRCKHAPKGIFEQHICS
jgi:hypothetical protein